MTRLAKLLLLALPFLVSAGCGEQFVVASVDDPASRELSLPETSSPRPSSNDRKESAPEVRAAVLFDDAWVVEEGVWSIQRPDDIFGSEDHFAGQHNGLLGASDPENLVISGPALYGQYRVRVELHPGNPTMPRWCEDAVEAPVHSSGSLQMWSFETMADPWVVPAGDYRVRYCAAGLDAADQETAEDEFDGDEYRIYSSRHLLQLWPAKVAPDEILRVGSTWAASRHKQIR